jgi:hypothetical protein
MEPIFVFITIVVTIAIAWGIHYDKRRRAALKVYWDRPCQGKEWKSRFPESTATEIRVFLSIFAESFGFRMRKRLNFSPSGKLLAIYRASNPDESAPDILELETFERELKKKYEIVLAEYWDEGVTLGDIYEHTRHAA